MWCSEKTCAQVQREPEEVRQEKLDAARAANKGVRAAQQAKNERKTKMKGKNKPSRRFRKKQSNIVEEKKVWLETALLCCMWWV